MSRSMQVPYKAYVTASLQTDLFLVYIYIFCFFFGFFFGFFLLLLFFLCVCVCERKAFPAQGRSDLNWFLVIGLDTPTGASF